MCSSGWSCHGSCISLRSSRKSASPSTACGQRPRVGVIHQSPACPVPQGPAVLPPPSRAPPLSLGAQQAVVIGKVHQGVVVDLIGGEAVSHSDSLRGNKKTTLWCGSPSQGSHRASASGRKQMWPCLLHRGKRKGHGRLGALLSLTQQNTFTAGTQGDERLRGWGCPHMVC